MQHHPASQHRPAKSLSLTLYFELDLRHQHKFGAPPTAVHTNTHHRGQQVPDCTARLDFLHQMSCKESDTVNTYHRIVGITDAPLGIIGVLFVTLQHGTIISHQMIHISRNCHRLYISQTAMGLLRTPSHTQEAAVQRPPLHATAHRGRKYPRNQKRYPSYPH